MLLSLIVNELNSLDYQDPADARTIDALVQVIRSMTAQIDYKKLKDDRLRRYVEKMVKGYSFEELCEIAWQ